MGRGTTLPFFSTDNRLPCRGGRAGLMPLKVYKIIIKEYCKMWTMAEFRINVLIGFVAFIAITAIACAIAQKVQDTKKQGKGGVRK